MDNLQKIVLLIDADNTRLSKLEAVIQEISTHGRIVVKRAYGNWKKDALKHWENELKRLAIKAEQQFDYVSGKNATDMALVISTLDLLHSNLYDAFAIVASDSDYTPLAIRLHESGVYVIGVGEKKTPKAFRNACDEFVFLENLQKETGLFKKNHLDSSSLFLVFLQKRISPLAVRGSYTGNVIDAFQRTSAVFLCCLLRQTVP